VSTYTYTVVIETDTQEHADQVILERVCFDEDYGFDYTIAYLEPSRGES